MRRRNKYNAIKTEYNGVKYDSQMEAKYAQELDLRVKANDIEGWIGQPKMPLIINNTKVGSYTPDFLIYHNDGTGEYIEIKGYETSLYKFRLKVFKALYPDLKLTVIKKV